jgi:UDP-N-acetyl-D-glucosamine dehydrogenase
LKDIFMNHVAVAPAEERTFQPGNHFRLLHDKIATRQARLGVIGLGYVGLPLCATFAEKGFRVTGIDVDRVKVNDINCGKSYIRDVPSTQIKDLVERGLLHASNDDRVLEDLDAVSICVPTPLHKTKDPDLSHILAAVEQIEKHLHSGMLIILESTTYPGTTEELVLPRLLRSGLGVGRDFFLCFSPERVDPGNPQFRIENIPKVVGGVTPACTEIGASFYRQVVERVVPVSSTRVAEMTKLLENTFRSVNIGLANEMALVCDRMKIDVWEVIEAAATKPFGFMPFFPGPGLGGHCIPVDPFYLSWKARMDGTESRFIELAARINGYMPEFVVRKVQQALNDRSKAVKSSHVHVLGVTYKKDVADTRESPALEVMLRLADLGARLTYSDPHVPRLAWNGFDLESQPVLPSCQEADCVVLITDHAAFDYVAISRHASLIVDTRNTFRAFRNENIFRL